ncbi:hypothetical protein [Oryza sativa Japonica Group]|uniref:Uncharacterized protein n=2 Tax=Oryza sativa subsp. japonica TaxID=39947 RepID=Q5ZDW8_ORYSJ|nr:hypothetical protein [Oryza sativa Japonica Group]BAD61272.1 hypothetical protein [Oryza sativa Japonica Group]
MATSIATGVDLTLMSLKTAASRNILFLLYQKSLKDKKSSENPRFEAHFNLTHKERPEVASSHQAPVQPESNLNVVPEDVAPLSAMDDMFIEYCSTDPLGDLQ